VLELFQQSLKSDGSLDETSSSFKTATQLMSDHAVKISPNDFKAYYIPYNERLFRSLSPRLKAQFAPRVFPQQ
jgi:hypothetical protein